VLAAAARAAASHPAGPRIIAAAYADLCTPSQLVRLINVAAASRATGVLLDTAKKDGHSLLDWLPVDLLRQWADMARIAGLLSGLAGSVSASQLPMLAAAGADVIGVRGAACDGGRNGSIDASRVVMLRQALARSARLEAANTRAGASARQDWATCKAPHHPVHTQPRATA
jgi:uncharacterized protein (UPF0264 family)